MGETEQAASVRARRAERVAEIAGEVGEDAGAGALRGVCEGRLRHGFGGGNRGLAVRVRFADVGTGAEQFGVVLGVLGLAGIGLGQSQQFLQVVAVRDATGRAHPEGLSHHADHGDGPVAGRAVGGEGVVGPAQVHRARLTGDHHTSVGLRRCQRPFDDFVGLHAHRPASRWVLRMLMSRNSADGQPWLTAATWPGWPLPQLKAPPRT